MALIYSLGSGMFHSLLLWNIPDPREYIRAITNWPTLIILIILSQIKKLLWELYYLIKCNTLLIVDYVIKFVHYSNLSTRLCWAGLFIDGIVQLYFILYFLFEKYITHTSNILLRFTVLKRSSNEVQCKKRKMSKRRSKDLPL